MIEDYLRHIENETRDQNAQIAEDLRINTGTNSMDEEGLTETQKAMRRMKMNVSVLNNSGVNPTSAIKVLDTPGDDTRSRYSNGNRESPLKSRRLS